MLRPAIDALEVGRPAEAYRLLCEVLERTDDPAIRRDALRLRNFASWLVGDWSDMPTIIQHFKTARELTYGSLGEGPTMLASVLTSPGTLELRRIPEPAPPGPGFVQIRVRAFGLNFTETGLDGWHVRHLAPVAPLVNGIECAGEVVQCGEPGRFAPGTRVVACAGSMGRGIDGTHAEVVLAPHACVVPVSHTEAELPWRQLAALPMSFGTAMGSLDACDAKAGDVLLVRGATSALGLACIALAKHVTRCRTVLATTRSSDDATAARLAAAGADRVLVDSGTLKHVVLESFPDGVDCAVECVGNSTLKDTLHCVRRKGTLCQTGVLGMGAGPAFHSVLGEVPSTVKVTCYESDGLTAATLGPLMRELCAAVLSGALKVPLDPAEFELRDIGAAFEHMRSKARHGKVVVTVAPAAP